MTLLEAKAQTKNRREANYKILGNTGQSFGVPPGQNFLRDTALECRLPDPRLTSLRLTPHGVADG